MGAGSKKHKGPRAKERERTKGAHQGPKKIGSTKPPSGMRPLAGVSGGKHLGKKAKKQAARQAAYALLDESSRPFKKGKHFSY